MTDLRLVASQEPAHPPACITLSRVGHRTVVRVAGELDLATAPELAAAIDASLDGAALELWVDLTSTSFMDSSGLNILIAARARAWELGRRLAIICPAGPVRRVFDIANVSDLLPIYDDCAAANRAS